MYGVHRNMTHSVRSISFRVYLIIILKAFVQILVPEKRGSMRWVRLCWVRLKRAEALAGLGRRLYLHYLVECPPPVISAPLCTVQPADGAKYFCQLLPTFVNYCQLLSTFWLRARSHGLTRLFLHEFLYHYLRFVPLFVFCTIICSILNSKFSISILYIFFL